MRTRSTNEVLEDHLQRRERGDIEGDLEHNDVQDVALLCEKGVLKGHDAVSDSAEAPADQVPDACFRFLFRAVDGEHALLRCSAHSENTHVDFGVDKFVIRNGRIVLQTVSYQLEQRNPKA